MALGPWTQKTAKNAFPKQENFIVPNIEKKTKKNGEPKFLVMEVFESIARWLLDPCVFS